MPDADQSKRAGVIDVSHFGEKDIANSYPPGTKFELDDGTVIEPDKVPDHIGGKAPKRRSSGPRSR
jgi:hypothetical protein